MAKLTKAQRRVLWEVARCNGDVKQWYYRVNTMQLTNIYILRKLRMRGYTMPSNVFWIPVLTPKGKKALGLR